MRFDDERYVRLYTRDTPTWLMLPWEGRALLPCLLRKVDRAGLLDLGDDGVEGLSILVGLPLAVVSAGLDALVSKRVVAFRGTVLVWPRFLEAQETPQNDRVRKAAQRERDRLRAVTDENVTNGHAESRGVTDGHSVPIRTVPSLTEPEKTSAAATPPRRSRGPAKPKVEPEPMPFTMTQCMDALRETGGVLVDPFPREPRFAVQATKLIRAYPDLALWRRVASWLASGGAGYGSGWRGGKPDVPALLVNFSAWAQQATAWDGASAVNVSRNGANGYGAHRVAEGIMDPASREAQRKAWDGL